MTHPLRLRILALLRRGPLSPRQAADALGEELGTVAYHFRTLADSGCVELAGERRKRGAVEHIYRRTERPWFSTEIWDQLPDDVKAGTVAVTVRLMAEEILDSVESGQFEGRADRHISRSPLRLDEQGWRELTALTDDLLEAAHRIEAEALGRRALDPGSESVPAFLHIAFFEGTPPAI